MGERQKITILTAKDCDISYFKGSGAGGQNRQKNSTGCQIIHRESGALGRCSETRSQLQNRKKAFRNLTETGKFKVWLAKKLYEISEHETMEQTVERMLAPHNLEVEVKDRDGNWVELMPGHAAAA